MATSSGLHSLGIGYSRCDISACSGVRVPTAGVENETRGHGVAADAARSVLHGHGLRELDDAGLGGAIRSTDAAGADALDRRGVDDCPTAALQHPGDGVLAAQDHAFEVHGNEPIEEGRVKILDIDIESVRRGVGRVVVQHVQATEGADGRCDHVSHAGLVRDVDPDGNSVAKFVCNASSCFQVDVCHDDGRAFTGHQAGGRGTDPAAAPRDDCHLAVEPSHAADDTTFSGAIGLGILNLAHNRRARTILLP